ncbi:MAG: inorganic diphosphatase [Bacilli bacterium]
MTNPKEFLGKEVTVVMDRQLGTKHPKWGFVYMVNYGYIEDTVAPDGEELDAYILGVFEPKETFIGECIAIVHRINDNDDKLIVVPKGKNYTDDQIVALTEFQEKFFESVIIRK